MNESETASMREEAAAYEFPSLAVLKAAHLKLLERESASVGPDFLEEAREFMMRARATGRILDDDKERDVAQTLLNYWATVLFRAGVPDEKIPRTCLAEMDESVGRDLDDSQCPYRGLDAYSESEAHLFFGRKQVIEDWLAVLREKRLLVVLGPSGSGKTSLIRAGLLPALRAGKKLSGSETWKVIEIALPPENPSGALRAVIDAEAKNPHALLVFLRFDEVFLHCDPRTQRDLSVAIADWLGAPDTERRAVAIARLEWAGALKQWLRGGKLASISKQAFIPLLGARELRAIIEEPAAQIGLRFEEGIVDTLVNEFLGDPAALALLQFTLIKLWDRRERNHITWAAYHAMGGTQGVVEKAAEAVYGAPDFEEEDRELTRKIFLRLVRPSLSRELVANSVPEAAFSSDPISPQRVSRIIERFEKAQLLRVHDPRGERTVEVTHEALLRRWPRLLQWLEDARIELLQRQRIGVAAAQWREQGRDPSALYSGVLLTAALSIRDQLSPTEFEFVEASRRAANWRRNRNLVLLTVVIVLLACALVYEIRRTLVKSFEGRETKAALNLERGERHLESGDPAGAFLFFHQAAVDDPSAKNNLRHWLWRLFIRRQGIFDDPSALKELVHQSRLGATWRQLPRLKHLLYLKNLTRSQLSPNGEYLVGFSKKEVRVWRVAKNDLEERSEPLRNVPEGEIIWASFHPNPQLPLMAIVAKPDPETKSGHGQVVIFDVKSNQRVGKPIYFAQGAPQKAWFSPGKDDSDLLLVVSQSSADLGKVSIWNFRNAERKTVLALHTLPVNWASFSPDGQWVITAAGDLSGGERGEAWVWDWKNDRSTALPHIGGPLRYAEFASAKFDDDGAHVLTAEGTNDTSRGTARVWSLRLNTTEPFLQVSAITAPLSHRGAVNKARFSPDGLWIATASSDHTARLWHVETQKEVLSFKHNGDVIDVVFSPDGRYLATGGRDRTARVWEVATGQAVQAPLNHSESVAELAYSHDGRVLVTSSKHLARAWAANSDEPKAPLLKATDPILTTVSGDGHRLLTVSKPIEKDGTKYRALELWRTDTAMLVGSAEIMGAGSISCAALNEGGNRLAVASHNSSGKPVLLFLEVPVVIGSDGNGRLEKTSELEDGIFDADEIVSAAFDREGKRLGIVLRKAGEKDQQLSKVALCDAAAGTVRILPGQEPSLVSRVQFSPKGTYLLACFTRPGEPEGYARLWKFDDESAVSSELHHSSAITTAAFDAKEQLLLTGSTDDDARLWKITEGRVSSSSQVLCKEDSEHTHTADLTRVLFSPDGRRALTASKDPTAILWDIENIDGKLVIKRNALLRHSGSVNDAAFSGLGLPDQKTAGAEAMRWPPGELILTSSSEPKLRVWSASGELLAVFIPPREVFQANFTPNSDRLVAIGQNSAESSAQVDSAMGESPAIGIPLREVQPVTWSFAPLHDNLMHVGERGKILAARQIGSKLLEEIATEKLPTKWESERAAYQSLFGAERDQMSYHDAAARECEATRQWFAAAWHLTKLLDLPSDNSSRADLLLRRAEAYAKADNRADSLPKCIEDRKTAIGLGRNRPEDYRALAEAYLDSGKASGKAEQWELAIEALSEGIQLHPGYSRNFLLLGEVFAGKRDFAQAEREFWQAEKLGSNAASARLALVGWLRGDEQGKQQYRELCMTLSDPLTKGWKAFSLLWPSVLTNAFESDDQYKDFCQEIVRRARESFNEDPSDYYRRNTLGAALYRAGLYAEAIKELEAALEASIAERVNSLSQSYDRLIRIPILRANERRPYDWGRPQDYAFLAMANARLGRRNEAWNWWSKLRDAPELARSLQSRESRGSSESAGSIQSHQTVSYETLALELLFYEAHDVLRGRSARQRGTE